jgi:Protein of unknown function (DUF3313)
MSRHADPARRRTPSLIAGLSLGIVCATVIAGAGIAQTPPTSLPGGLEQVQNARVKLAYAKPGINWSQFKTIQLLPLSIPPSARNTAPPGAEPELGETYILGKEQITALQAAYEQQMKTVLGNAGFTFVDKPQANTLIVAAKITGIRLNAPLASSRFGGMDETFTRGSGAMGIEAVFGDGATNTVIAEAADAQYPSDMWEVNNSVTNADDARNAFATWANDLRQRLQQQ